MEMWLLLTFKMITISHSHTLLCFGEEPLDNYLEGSNSETCSHFCSFGQLPSHTHTHQAANTSNKVQ